MHFYGFDVSLAPDPSTSPAYQEQHGDTDYYFFETQDLPLFGPLRTLGVPEPLIDVVEPFFRVIVELGYDRSIPPWEPTPARLIPTLDPVTVATDLVNAIGEGINNAAALIGAPPPLSMSQLCSRPRPRNQRMRYRPPNQRTRIFRSRRLRPETTPPKTGPESTPADVFPQVTTEALSNSGQAT